MAAFSVDTSCMVAAVCSWHERHHAAAAAIEDRFARGQRLVVAAHALLETYAVLTRLPAPHRLSAADSWTLIKANFIDQGTVEAPSGQQYVALIGNLAERAVVGGRSYDALIAASLAGTDVTELLTFNTKHFDSTSAIVAVEPGAAT